MLNEEMQNAQMSEEIETVASAYSGELIKKAGATYVKGYGYVVDDELEQAAYEGEIIRCAECGELVGRCIAERGADGRDYCPTCFNQFFVTCDRCGEPEWRCNTHEVHMGDHRYDIVEEWCSECANEYANRCDDCGEYFTEELTEVYNGDEVCGSCLENYRCCDECGEFYPESDGEWDEEDDRWVCNSCSSDKCNRRIIHDYHSFKAPLVFLGDAPNRDQTLHMGVELEIDRGGEISDNALAIVEAGGNTINETITCMHDGSLRRGFEIISQPATLDYHTKNYGWDKMMQKALSLGYRSHDANTCGMHVHVDRTYFSDSFVDESLGMALLAVNNRSWLKKFSRRTDYYYCPFPDDGSDYGQPYKAEDFCDKKCRKAGKRRGVERLYDLEQILHQHYSCINTYPRATVEFRFFRGTLKFDTFIANLQLVEMMCYAVRNFRYEQLCNIGFHWFMRLAKRRGYKEFIEFANKRIRGMEDNED